MWIILDPNGVAFWMVLDLHRAVQVARKLDSFTMLAEGMSRSWPNLQARIWPHGRLGNWLPKMLRDLTGFGLVRSCE